MFSFILMIGFSISLMSYGFIALFKSEWLMKLRSFSAQIEGKSEQKHDNVNENLATARKIMAIFALVLGTIGLIVTLATIFVYLQAQSGIISI